MAAESVPWRKYVLIGHDGYGAAGRRVLGLLPRFFAYLGRSLVVTQLRLGRASLPGRADAMALLATLLDTGSITPIIDSTYPLSRAREALRHLVDDVTLGKVVVVP